VNPARLLDLDFAGSDTLYATHGLHAFAAKCPPPLARWGIKTYSHPGEIVFDPMVGSGTTLVEARLLGRRAIGADIDPLARLIAEVKATPLTQDQLKELTVRLLAAVDAAKGDAPLAIPSGAAVPFAPKRNEVNLEKWFLPEVASDLTLLKQQIAQVETSIPARRFLWVAFSSLILARTSVANARDVVHSRHHYWQHPTPPDVIATFRRRLTIMLRMMAEFATQCAPLGSTTVLGADIRHLPLAADSVDLVFTSPPYGTALDYTRAHYLAVAWLQDVLGISTAAYALEGRRYIGTERGLLATFDPVRTPLPAIPDLQRLLRELAETDAQKARALAKYFVDMQTALAEMGRVVKPSHHIVLVVCPSHIRKIQIPTNVLLVQMAEQLCLPGDYQLELEQEIERTLDDRRRILPYMTDAFGQRMRTEYVIVLRKVKRPEMPNAR
jgi:hypothetical protein